MAMPAMWYGGTHTSEAYQKSATADNGLRYWLPPKRPQHVVCDQPTLHPCNVRL